MLGTPYTVDELVDIEPVGGGPNGSCLWEAATLGINASHPGAQPYYNSKVCCLIPLHVDSRESKHTYLKYNLCWLTLRF